MLSGACTVGSKIAPGDKRRAHCWHRTYGARFANSESNIADSRVTFASGSAIELPLRNEGFDMVVAWESNEHIPTWSLIAHRQYRESQSHHYREDAGLELSALVKKGRLWSLVDSLNMYVTKWLLRRTSVFGNLFSSKEEQEYSEDSGLATIFATYRKQA
jgi:hypothetical protein